MIPRLVVGLGNPGIDYRDTRHNVGFMIIDEVARRMGTDFQTEKRWKSLLARSGSTLLAKPQAFMNASGEAVMAIAHFFKLKPEQIKSFPPETLFYCYYHFPQDMLQLHAAQELNTRGWKIHKESKLWMTTSPAGSKDWVYFDPVEWQTKPVTADQGSTDATHFLPLPRAGK
jgi:hypothetical protein